MARRIDKPVPGYFKIRLCSRGPWVPARIYLPCPIVEGGIDSDADPEDWCCPLERSRSLHAEIHGRPAAITRVWAYGRPISRHDYDYIEAYAGWLIRVGCVLTKPLTGDNAPPVFF